MHPDAVIALAASGGFKRARPGNLRRRDRLVALDAAGIRTRSATARVHAAEAQLTGAVLEAHGLFTWADSSKACYENTLDIINRATA